MKKIRVYVALAACLLLLSGQVSAQCAMCRANAESNMKSQTNSVGKGLNKGIIYLMTVPYLLGGAAIFIWYKNKKR